MFDLLAIDWGSKYFGIALGSSFSRLVVPINTQETKKTIINFLKKEVYSKGVKVIVLGIPTNFKNQPTEKTLQVQKFAKKLENLFPQIKIILVNENKSSQLAKLLYKKNLHNQSAARILEYYLEF